MSAGRGRGKTAPTHLVRRDEGAHQSLVTEVQDACAFRITIEKSVALPVLLEVMGSVDYTSFKGACGQDSRYHLTLSKVWNIMYSYQSEMESLI